MKRSINLILILVLTLSLYSCRKTNFGDPPEWSIPMANVQDGGPGKDGIPSIDDPVYINVPNVSSYLKEEDLVIGINYNNDPKAIPHYLMDWHEIVNDESGDKKFSIVYCPLTGTATSWNRVINGSETTFGVSGLLYNSNVIPYDRATDSNWSQIWLECVNGDNINQVPESYQVLETTYGKWKEMYPNTQVLSEETGFDRTYDAYPYGDYKTNNDRLIFPVDNTDDRLLQKERVHGIFSNDKNVKAYPLTLFSDTNRVIHDSFENQDYVIAGNDDFIVSFANPSNLTFTVVQDSLPIIMMDNSGTYYDVFGNATSGTGSNLTSSTSMMGYWFSFPAFYSNTEIYTD